MKLAVLFSISLHNKYIFPNTSNIYLITKNILIA